MKNAIKFILSLLIINGSFLNVNAQIGINNDGSNPDASAMLDVKSTDKGVLIPRMTTTQRDNINSPATGLMIYNNTMNSFNYYNGTAWIEIKTGTSSSIADADNDTKIEVEASADEDSIRFHIMGTERLVLRQNTYGMTMINLPNSRQNIFLGQDAGLNSIPSHSSAAQDNIFIGYQSGRSNTSGSKNMFLGKYAGYSNTTATENIFIGNEAGYSNTIGNNNTYIGSQAGYLSTTASSNTFIGSLAGYKTTTGFGNLFLGLQAGYNNTTGQRNLYFGTLAGYSNVDGIENTFIGIQAGFSNVNGSGNVLIGNEAGYNETGSNKLYIDNSNISNPLIYGEFDNDLVRVNGTFNINNAFSFPTADGTTGQVLKTDGSGVLTWTTLSNNSLSDSDNDTKIQVEESADEDSIRIDIMGSERVVFRQNSGGMTMINLPNTHKNIFIGQDAGLNTVTGTGTQGTLNKFIGNLAGYSNTTGTSNLFFGNSAGFTNTTGNSNLFIGDYSGKANTTGNFNLFLGEYAGEKNTTGTANMFFGASTGGNNTTGQFNLFIGNSAGITNTTGNNNVYLGSLAGVQNTGSSNVFLGHNAGFNETASDNKLFIENSDAALPLIYGEFDTDWIKINGNLSASNGFTDNDNNTKIQVEKNPNEDIIRFDVGGTEYMVLTNGKLSFENNGSSVFIGKNAGINDDLVSNHNVFVGADAGTTNTSGTFNSFIGNNAGNKNTTGISNTFLGGYAGNKNTIGASNTFIGVNTGINNTAGNDNTFTGVSAGSDNITGHNNSFYGVGSGLKNQTGSNNTAYGFQSGFQNVSGSGNVFLGRLAGYSETGSNKLYIANSNTSTPLIYGEFDNKKLQINGTVIAGSAGTVNTTTLNGLEGIVMPGLTSDYIVSVQDGNGRVQHKWNASYGLNETFIVGGEDAAFIDITGQADNDTTAWIEFKHADGAAAVAGNSISWNTQFMITQAGNVGLSETSPDDRLHLTAGGNGTRVRVENTSNGWAGVVAKNTIREMFFGIQGAFDANPGEFHIFDNTAGAQRMVIAANGNVGINEANPSVTLDVNGSVNCTGGTCSSDKRWKKDIQPLQNSLANIQKLQGVSYYWRTNEFPNKDFNNTKQIGVIAQEVEKIYPELINTNNEGYKSMDYMSLTAILLEGVKEQQNLIEEQNQRITELEKQVEKIKELEAMMKEINAKL